MLGFFYSGTSVHVTDGQWHHVCLTWDASSAKYKMYKDGAVVESGAASGYIYIYNNNIDKRSAVRAASNAVKAVIHALQTYYWSAMRTECFCSYYFYPLGAFYY